LKNYPLNEHKQLGTLRELLHYCDETFGENIAFRYAVRKEEVEVSHRRFRQEADALGAYLYDQGFARKHIAVFGSNSYEWILTHFAVTCSGGVIVPIDKELTAEEIVVLLRDSESAALVFDPGYADVAQEIAVLAPDVQLYSMKKIPAMVTTGSRLIAGGARESLEARVSRDDLASIVYTSGTTGKSKGVMLTHFNLTSDVHGACGNILNEGDTLLVLPLHHTFGLVAGVLAMMFYGNAIYINRSLKQVLKDFSAARPQMMFVVPLILETLYKNIWATARKKGKEKALKVLVKVSDALYACGIDLRRLLFKTVHDSLGGKLEYVISGGAPLDERLVRAFRSFGITVLNGYGITECGPVVSVNRNRCAVPGSVGFPLRCNKVKISEEGEVLVRGTNVMQGYYHNDEENRKAFIDGWFRTGDLGRIDEHGALHITGRIKNLIILSNGENIPAESLEEKILTIPYVKEAVAYGQDDVIVAEVFLDEEMPEGREKMDADIQAINKTLPLVRNIGRVIVRDTEFPKTTTKKIKRNYGGNDNA